MIVGAVIVAAGIGSRFGSKKQFEKLNGKIVLSYSVEIFKDICDKIVIVTQDEDIDFVKKQFPFTDVAAGGSKRMNSVYNGLSAISCDTVLVHDAARPLINREFVKKIIEVAAEKGSCVPTLKISETIKSVIDDRIVNTVDRNGMYLAQTPQAFDFVKLKKAYEKVMLGRNNYTDESSIFEEVYGFAHCIDGIRKNIKITVKEDLEFAECLLG